MANPNKCPACKTINEPNAIKCDCGYDFINKMGGSKQLYKSAKRSDSQKFDWFGGKNKKTIVEGIRALFILSVVIYGTYWIFYSNNDSNSVEKPIKSNTEISDIVEPKPVNAFSAAQEYVKLAIPEGRAHTAKFPWLDYSGMEVSKNRFQIKSYVNFQNVFGADIRWEWSAIIDYIEGDIYDSKSWDLITLRLNNELFYNK